MQINTLDTQQLADTLEASEILDIIDTPGLRTYILEFDKQDILIFSPDSGTSVVVYPPESFDAESGGSVHDHARAVAAA